MYRSVLVRYKMIFKNEYGNETVEYKNTGVVLDNGTSHTVSFTTKDGTIEIIYNQNEIILNNGNSRLGFYYNKERWNDYNVQFGTIRLKTKLLKFEANDSLIKMKYELYDQSGLLQTAYMLMNIKPYHFSEE